MATDQILSLIRLGFQDTIAPLQNKIFGISSPLGCKPTNVNIEITNRCCLRCQMCDSWKRHSKDELDMQEWMDVIDSLKNWLGSFRLTITGGEPFMKPGIWDFLEYCVRLNLPVVVITNGFCFTSRQLQRLLTLHLTQIVISLDSLNPQIHDRVRGVSGAFEQAWRTMRYLATHKGPFLLSSSTVIMDHNILELGCIASQLKKVGVDRILFQPIQGGFVTEHDANWPYDFPVWPSSQDRIKRGIRSLLEAKACGAPVVHTAEEIVHFKSYLLQGSKWIRPWPCSAGYTTFHCDAFGQVRMCVPYARNIGDLRIHSPVDIWNSDVANRERELILACKKPCMLNCNRKYTLAEKLNYADKVISRSMQFLKSD